MHRVFNPFDWYWKHVDGRIYSSRAGGLVSANSESFKAFLDEGNLPTNWPNDEAGTQTDQALEDVLMPYGLTCMTPPLSSLEASRRAKLDELKTACAAEITGGYHSSALGADHLYPSGMIDQLNMTASVTASLIPNLPAEWRTAFWCEDPQGIWEYRPHNVAEIQKAGADGKDHVMACQWKLATLTASVEAATNLDALSGITWS